MFEHEIEQSRPVSDFKTKSIPSAQFNTINSNSLSRSDVMQLQRIMGNQAVTQLLQKRFHSASKQDNNTIQKKESNTNSSLPNELKAGIEHLSGIDLSDVTVHYNSNTPANLNAHAYAQGTDIHLAPGQEKHLPHEAWHVVQQKQGRVHATTQMNGQNINDDSSLEHEADVMGQKGLLMGKTKAKSTLEFQHGVQLASKGLDIAQLVKGDTHVGEVKLRSSDQVTAIFVNGEIRPWFNLPTDAQVKIGDTVSFKEGDNREVTELVVTVQAPVVAPVVVVEPTDYSSSIDLSKVTIVSVGGRYAAHNAWDDTEDYLKKCTASILNTRRKNLKGDGWVYAVPMGNGITKSNPLYGQVLFNYVATDNKIEVFHAHGNEPVPTKMG